MRWAILIFVVAVLVISPVRASGECKVEAWRAYSSISSMIMVEGTTTCPKGMITIRLYSGSGDSAKFIGIANGLITGNSFQAVAINVNKPAELSIKYSIDPGGF